jgi:hypothetical protein
MSDVKLCMATGSNYEGKRNCNTVHFVSGSDYLLGNYNKTNKRHPTYEATGILRLVAFNDKQRPVTIYVL